MPSVYDLLIKQSNTISNEERIHHHNNILEKDNLHKIRRDSDILHDIGIHFN